MRQKIKLTASMMRAYKSCPRLYELQYLEMLKPAITPEPLLTGSSYHGELEKILKGEQREPSADIPGIMADAFQKYIPFETWNVQEVEHEFSFHLGYCLWIGGKIDAITADGIPVEHKSTRNAIDEKYIDKLAWDDQVSFYLLALSKIKKQWITKVIYTACQKPTIRLKQKETMEEYLERCREWYTEDKIQTFSVVRSVHELEEKEAEIRELAHEIRHRKSWYRNPSHCSIIGCSYSGICLNYDPETVMGFVKKERRHEELCKF